MKKHRLWTTAGLVLALLLLIVLIALTAVVLTKVNKNNHENTVEIPTAPPTTESPECPANPLNWQDMACCRQACPKGWGKRPLLLVSMDGFRADYLARNKTPSIQQMINCGTHAPFMFPSYVSVTFPNHYAIVTGLYPESHGIIDNEMYDPTITNASNRYFDISKSSSLDPQWWLGEPIWNTVVKNNMKSGTYFWPGSDVRIQNMTPTYWLPYDGSVPFYQRVDQVVEWLLYPDDKRPQFVNLYFDQPDNMGHQYGPYSPEVTNELVVIDSFINYLMNQLFENNLLNCIDIILVADHGMEQTNQTIYMSAADYFNVTVKDLDVFSGPVGRVQVEPNPIYSPDYIFDSLVCKNNFSRVYYRKEVPRRLHYAVSDRIGDVVIDMDDTFMFEKYNDYLKGNFTYDLGEHGYDFKYHSMHALFVAFGPSFKKRFTAIPFQNIELYNLFSDLLEIQLDKRAPTNGTLGVLDQILVEPPERTQPIFQPLATCPFQSSGLQTCGSCDFLSNDKCTNQFSPVLAQNLNITSTVCGSTTCDYVSIYYANLSMPVMVQAQITYSSKMTTNDQIGCSTIDNNSTCNTVSDKLSALQSLNASMYSLLDFDAATSAAATLWYAKVPMYDGFYQGAWKWTQDFTRNYTTTYQKVIVFAGPIFDYDYNGLADNLDTIWNHSTNGIPIPTHFYQILLRCDGNFDQNGLCNGNPYVLSFILPHIARPRNYCQTPENYLFKNTARIRDIELLTGVQFFTNWDFHKAIQLRTKINDQI